MVLRFREALLLFLLYWLQFVSSQFIPEQVHLSYGENESSMVVTWSTLEENTESIVEYGINVMNLTAYGKSDKFVDGGSEKRLQYIHRVTLSNLRPNTKYVYRCGGSQKWSEQFWFKTTLNSTTETLSLAFYGDLGVENAAVLPYLINDTQSEIYDAVFHIGDFAYNMDYNNGRLGDDFMNTIQPIAAYVPYMVCVGNHEQKYNFSHYKARFSMPSNSENLWYSFNLGPVHFIGFSSEVYYYHEDYGLMPTLNQYNWLENDLKEATKPENRNLRPWIIPFTHRPMYCSNRDSECANYFAPVRSGINRRNYGLEDLFYKYKVDVIISGHQHSYQRLWPVYKHKVYKASNKAPYTNPKVPVHVVTGAAGSLWETDKFFPIDPKWSAFKSSDYSYTRLKISNITHLHFEQISSVQYGKRIDEFWIIKDKRVVY